MPEQAAHVRPRQTNQPPARARTCCVRDRRNAASSQREIPTLKMTLFDALFATRYRARGSRRRGRSCRGSRRSWLKGSAGRRLAATIVSQIHGLAQVARLLVDLPNGFSRVPAGAASRRRCPFGGCGTARAGPPARRKRAGGSSEARQRGGGNGVSRRAAQVARTTDSSVDQTHPGAGDLRGDGRRRTPDRLAVSGKGP